MSRYDIALGKKLPPKDPEIDVVYNVTPNGLCNALAEHLSDSDNKKVMDILRSNRFFSKLRNSVYCIFESDLKKEPERVRWPDRRALDQELARSPDRRINATWSGRPGAHTVQLNFSEEDLTMSVDQFSDRYLTPVANSLAASLDSTLLTPEQNDTIQRERGLR